MQEAEQGAVFRKNFDEQGLHAVSMCEVEDRAEQEFPEFSAGRALGDYGLARVPVRLGTLWVEGKGTKLVVKPEGGRAFQAAAAVLGWKAARVLQRLSGRA